jgi:hypothetical protein
MLLIVFVCSFFVSQSQGHISDKINFNVPNGFEEFGFNRWKNKNNPKEFISIEIVEGNKINENKPCIGENPTQEFIKLKSITINDKLYDLCVSDRDNISIIILPIYSKEANATLAIAVSASKKNYERCEELISFIVDQLEIPSSNQNKIIFTDGESVNLSVLNNQLIEIIGESNLLFPKSIIEQFIICFFSKIASNSSYKTYQEDLIKAEKYSENKDERTYFLYSINYINSALWSCMNENPKFLEEYSKVDKIIPQSDLKIKTFAEVHLADLKKEMGIFQFIELGKTIDWENYSQCFARKVWMSFTPKEMYNMSPQNEKKMEKMMETCMEDNLKNN